MASLTSRNRGAFNDAYTTGALVMLAATAVILLALGFEVIGNYIPCPLCLQQRYAYYAGIPATFVALVLVSGGNRRLAGVIFVLVALAFLANTGLGIYQSGAEWKYWPGPQSCGTMQTIGGASRGLFDVLDKTTVIKCDEAQWRLAGLSFAGWNAAVSIMLTIASLKAASAAFRQG
jgi:disulfide bond formation protein DsbB